MLAITNAKVAGFIPRWAQFHGFSIILDQPDSCYLRLPKGLSELDCSLSSDQGIDLYRGLDRMISQLGEDDLGRRYLFCRLPFASYHVTLLDGINDNNVACVADDIRAGVKDWLRQSPFFHLPEPLKMVELHKRLIEPLTYTFDRLEIFDDQALVALLRPKVGSEDAHSKLTKFRGDLADAIAQTGILTTVSYAPHVSVGYFMNQQYGALARAMLPTWTSQARHEIEELSLTFSSVGLHMFTDMSHFFRKS
jgi:hypothetical protein